MGSMLRGVYVEGFGWVHFQMDFGSGLGAHRIPGARQVGGKCKGSGAVLQQTSIWIQDTGYRPQTTGYMIQDTYDTGNRIQDT